MARDKYIGFGLGVDTTLEFWLGVKDPAEWERVKLLSIDELEAYIEERREERVYIKSHDGEETTGPLNIEFIGD